MKDDYMSGMSRVILLLVVVLCCALVAGTVRGFAIDPERCITVCNARVAHYTALTCRCKR